MYLWNGSDGSISELVTLGKEIRPVTSVSWAPDGRTAYCYGVEWDSVSNRMLRTLRGMHESQLGSLSWNNNILKTGGKDGKIVNNDVRAQSHIVQRYQGHEADACSLKCSSSGQQLDSGRNDNLLYTTTSSNSLNQNQSLHQFEDHTSAVKALAWCPFQSNLLTSGEGDNDRCIKFWNTQGRILSEVSAYWNSSVFPSLE